VLRTAALLLVLGLVNGCGPREPVRVGFLGGLSGRVADLGEAGRNGAQIAVEEVNRAGGIDGRRVELIVRDDAQNPEKAISTSSGMAKPPLCQQIDSSKFMTQPK